MHLQLRQERGKEDLVGLLPEELRHVACSGRRWLVINLDRPETHGDNKDQASRKRFEKANGGGSRRLYSGERWRALAASGISASRNSLGVSSSTIRSAPGITAASR